MGAASNEWQGANPMGMAYASCLVAILHSARGRHIRHLAYLCRPCSYFWVRTSENAQKAKFAEFLLCQTGSKERPPARRCRSLNIASKFGRLRFAALPLSEL